MTGWVVALSLAQASSQPLVVLVSMERCCPSEAWPQAEQATKREFEALGLRVEVTPGVATGERERRVELGVVAEERKAACAVRIVRPRPADTGIEVWVDDRVTGKTLFRQVTVKGTSDDASLVGLRTAEAVRASLLEAAVSRKPEALPSGFEPLLRPVMPPALVEETVSSVSAQVAVGPWFSPGDVPVQGAVEVGAAVSLSSRFALLGLAGVSVVGDGVVEGGLRSTFNVALVRALAVWTPRAGPLRFRVGGGAGALVPWATGLSTNAGAVTDRTLVAWFGGTARVGLPLSSRVSLWLNGDAGLSLPEVRVLFAEVVVARFGRPLLSASVGFEVWL